MTSIPATLKDLTPEWFTSILRLPKNNHIESVQLEPLGEKDSVSGYIYRAKLNYKHVDKNALKSIILKMPRPRDTRTPFLLKAYIREVRFYEKLAQNIGIPVPKLIYADVDTETSDYILALEDFPESTNVRNETGAQLDQAYKLLEYMARFHAKNWASPNLSRYNFLNNLENIIDMMDSGLPQFAPVFLSRFSQYIEPDEMKLIASLPEYFRAIVTPLLDSPQTIVHNDYAMKNILIIDKSDETSFVLVDWANVGRGPGVRDLSFFIGTSIPPEMRTDYEFKFLQHYWEFLRDEGVSDYSFDSLVEDYRRTVVIDLARMVFFGGREFFNSMYESIIKQDIKRRTGSVKELDLNSLY